MFEYFRAGFANKFNHPILALIFVIGGIFALLGGLVQILIELGYTEWSLGAAFFGVYAVFMATIALTSYTVILLARYISIARDKVGPAA